ncbi:hypothetical protein U1Q18_035251 [Sarracenia purpurea var. burkii]
MRFLLSSIGLFSPVPTLFIDALGIVSIESSAIKYHSPVASAIGAISRYPVDQTSVAVVDDDGILIGEISPYTLAYYDEIAAAVVTTLSVGYLMAYIDCGGLPEDLPRLVKARLEERNLEGMLEDFIDLDASFNFSSSSSSSNDETLESLSATRRHWRRWGGDCVPSREFFSSCDDSGDRSPGQLRLGN